jgi:hypothetical protein
MIDAPGSLNISVTHFKIAFIDPSWPNYILLTRFPLILLYIKILKRLTIEFLKKIMGGAIDLNVFEL